jgi:hypothetical protein
VGKSVNSTHISLIPKSSSPSSFENFRPISCCNLIYKIIAKILANHLKSIFNNFIFAEQFGFLFNHQIHDYVSLTQEALHSIKKKKIPAFIMKLYLSKSFDRVNCTYLRLIMIQLGMNLESINWIMCYLESSSFIVLINGHPSPNFSSSRGLKQRCPMSPCLFLFVVEGSS